MSNNIELQAKEFFKEYKKAKNKFLKLSSLREEKLSVIGYGAYVVLFLGMMALVGIRIYGITFYLPYVILGVITAAALIYLISQQIRIGMYEKIGRKKRDTEFQKVKSEYLKLQEKYDYYSALKKCSYNEELYKENIEAERLKKEKERKEKAEKISANKKPSDSVCIYSKKGICTFEGDETVYSFKCDFENCRWRTKRK